MTNKKNIFSRFFRVLVMLHKIPYAYFTEWNNRRKRKALAAGIYFLSILPEFVLLAGILLAAKGQPVYTMQVRETDMDGEFRAGLQDYATIEEIRDGRRIFAECTWIKGYTPDSIRVLLTVWYEMKKVELCPVDSLEWTEDMEF